MWTYKHIIVDEGQDFNDECISALSSIAEYNEGNFYTFYDKYQFVQQRGNLPIWLEKAECRLVLNCNCRNTEQILITSGKPIKFSPKLLERSVKGERPLFFIANDEKKRLFYVAASRAKHQLDICFAGTENELQKLAHCICGDVINDPKRTLTEYLGVRFLV